MNPKINDPIPIMVVELLRIVPNDWEKKVSTERNKLPAGA